MGVQAGIGDPAMADSDPGARPWRPCSTPSSSRPVTSAPWPTPSPSHAGSEGSEATPPGGQDGQARQAKADPDIVGAPGQRCVCHLNHKRRVVPAAASLTTAALHGTQPRTRPHTRATSPTLATRTPPEVTGKPLRVSRTDARLSLRDPNLGRPTLRPLRPPGREPNQLRHPRRASRQACTKATGATSPGHPRCGVGPGQGHNLGLHLRVADPLTGRVRPLTSEQRIVEHHSGKAKRPGQQLGLARSGVSAVTATSEHPLNAASPTDIDPPLSVSAPHLKRPSRP
jgi:hypothetical protein